MKTVLTSLILFFCSVSWAAAAPQVVVSIKPLHALVAGVMQGVAEPQLLVRAGGTPHGYTLRPSDARALSRADLVIWVGHQLEGFLEKPLTTLGREAHQLELAEVLRPFLLPLREGGGWEEHAGEEDHHREGHASGGEINPHFWLSPELAKRVVLQVSSSLIAIDPAHQQQYQGNAGQMLQRLDELHARLSKKLAPVKTVPYLVFHDAYLYFEEAYGLNAVGSITVDPERRPGARRIHEMREKIKATNARCVFSEPQFEPRLVATIIEGTGAGTGVLDPLGAELEPGPESYFQLMNNLADNLLKGLR